MSGVYVPGRVPDPRRHGRRGQGVRRRGASGAWARSCGNVSRPPVAAGIPRQARRACRAERGAPRDRPSGPGAPLGPCGASGAWCVSGRGAPDRVVRQVARCVRCLVCEVPGVPGAWCVRCLVCQVPWCLGRSGAVVRLVLVARQAVWSVSPYRFRISLIGWCQVSPPELQSPQPPEVTPCAWSPLMKEPPESPGSAHTLVLVIW